MKYHSLQEIIDACSSEKVSIWEIIANEEAKEQNTSIEMIYGNMLTMYNSMKQADEQYDGHLKSASGLSGGDGEKLAHYNESKNLCGDYISKVMETAIKMGESNACMKRIVAAPTAGSCGVLPAVFITYDKLYKPSISKIIEALIIAGGIGEIIAENASISGAEGGCQAEIGSASAMAAGGLVYLEGGNNLMIINAAALALKNMLGLTCDPVAGLVEVPCVKRNVSGAVNAITSAQLSLAGIKSAIAPDEVIDSMRRIGHLIPPCLRETGEEGLAITPSAMSIKDRLL